MKIWVRRINNKIVEIAKVKQKDMTEQLEETDDEIIEFKKPPINPKIADINNIKNIDDVKNYLLKYDV